MTDSLNAKYVLTETMVNTVFMTPTPMVAYTGWAMPAVWKMAVE